MVRAANKKRRVRLSAEEAQERILDAAETLIQSEGLQAMRLKEVANAADASVSNVLYHFGNREGLLEALFQRASLRFREALLTLTQAPSKFDMPYAEESLVRLFDLVADPARAKIFGAVIASGGDPFPRSEESAMRESGRALHAERLRRLGVKFPLKDTLYILQLGALSMFGELTVGDAVRRRLGVPLNARERRKFRVWAVRQFLRMTSRPPSGA